MILSGYFSSKLAIMMNWMAFLMNSLSRAVLQINYNRNIPPNQVDAWRENSKEAVCELEEVIESRRQTLLTNRESSGVLRELQEPYDEMVSSDMVEE